MIRHRQGLILFHIPLFDQLSSLQRNSLDLKFQNLLSGVALQGNVNTHHTTPMQPNI